MIDNINIFDIMDDIICRYNDVMSYTIFYNYIFCCKNFHGKYAYHIKTFYFNHSKIRDFDLTKILDEPLIDYDHYEISLKVCPNSDISNIASYFESIGKEYEHKINISCSYVNRDDLKHGKHDLYVITIKQPYEQERCLKSLENDIR